MYLNKVICSECNGSGHLPHYKHINNGICYACGGSGLTDEYNIEQKETPDPAEHYKDYIVKSQPLTNKMNKEECENRLLEIEKLVKHFESEWRKGNDVLDKLEDLKSEYRDIQKKLQTVRRAAAK